MSDAEYMALTRALLAGSVVVAMCSCGSQTALPISDRRTPAYLVSAERSDGRDVVETLSARGNVLRVLGQDSGTSAPEWARGHSEAVWRGPRGISAGDVNGGSPPRTIFRCRSCTSFDLSPDGRTLLVTNGAAQRKVVTVALATGKQTVISPAARETDYDVSRGWSPDGKSFLYERYGLRGTLELVLRGGSGARVLLRTPKYPGDLRAAWSPDGRQVAFVETTGLETGHTRAGIVDIASGRVRFLPIDAPSPAQTVFAWAPNSRHLAISDDGRGPGMDVFTASGRLLHFIPVLPDWLAWTGTGLYILPNPWDKSLLRSAKGTNRPARLFHVTKSTLKLYAVVPR